MPKQAITRLTGLMIEPELRNINNGLFYLPQMTTAQMNAIPAANLKNGAMLYDTDTDELMVYKGNAWVTVTTA